MSQRILVTGSSGRIGRSVVAELVKYSHVVGYDCQPPPDGSEPTQFVRGELPNDSNSLAEAMSGVDCVIHLAGIPDDTFGPGDVFGQSYALGSPVARLIEVNALGTCQVLMAAVQVGRPRVILASSIQVVDGLVADGRSRVSAESPLAPKYLYASTKVFVEAAGRAFAKAHRLPVLVVRLGWCPRPDQHTAIMEEPRAPFMYLSAEDVGRFFKTAVFSRWPTQRSDPNDGSDERLPFQVVYATSQPPGGEEVYDLSSARLLGFVPDPADDWQVWLRK